MSREPLALPLATRGSALARWQAGHVAARLVAAGGGAEAVVVDPVAGSPAEAPGDVTFADGSLSPTEFAGAVGEAVRRIQAGKLDKVVLARDLDVRAAEPIDVRWLLARLAERVRLPDGRVALLCACGDARRCHRTLVAGALAERHFARALALREIGRG